MAAELVHATAIAAGGRAALIRGPSGSGKSDLALRCMSLAECSLIPERPTLVSDDQVLLDRIGDTLHARAPATIAGKIEVRGLGIITVPTSGKPVPVTLAVHLDATHPVERLPDPWPQTCLLGVALPLLTLNPFEASAPLKLMLALSSPNLRPQA